MSPTGASSQHQLMVIYVRKRMRRGKGRTVGCIWVEHARRMNSDRCPTGVRHIAMRRLIAIWLSGSLVHSSKRARSQRAVIEHFLSFAQIFAFMLGFIAKGFRGTNVVEHFMLVNSDRSDRLQYAVCFMYRYPLLDITAHQDVKSIVTVGSGRQGYTVLHHLHACRNPIPSCWVQGLRAANNYIDLSAPCTVAMASQGDIHIGSEQSPMPYENPTRSSKCLFTMLEEVSSE